MLYSSITYTDWNFGEIGVNVWGIDPNINDGYPYLLWLGVPSSITVKHPSIGNLVFFEDSVTSIDWSNNIVEVTDTFLLYLSTDNGVAWSFVDSTFNGDTSYVWTVPGGIQTDEALVLVTTLDSSITDLSDTAFTILPLPQSYTDIEIVSVVPQPMIAGGDLNVFVKSTYLDTFQLFWSYDSLTWTLIEQVAVDTVNGQIHDTTNYFWDNPSLIGDFYLRALEIRNGNLFYDQDTVQVAGSRVVAGNCYNITSFVQITDCISGGFNLVSGSEGIQELKAVWDPSCGWNSNVGWRFYRVLLRESISAGLPYYSSSYNVCPACERQCLVDESGNLICTDACVYPTPVILEIHDTVANARARYSDFGGTEGAASMIVNNRRYTLAYNASTEKYYVMVEDLLNSGVFQILYEYTSAVSTGGFQSTKLVDDVSTHRLGSYVKPISTWGRVQDSSYISGLSTVIVMKNASVLYDDPLHNRLVDSLGHNFGDYNEGYILVGEYGGRYNTYYGSVLPAPQYLIPVSEDVVFIQGATTRSYMRGIYPEAILLMRSRK